MPPRICVHVCMFTGAHSHMEALFARSLADARVSRHVYQVRCRASMSVHIDKAYEEEVARAGDGALPEEVSA